MKRIESVNNKIIKLVSSLKLKKSREKEGLFFAEGERNVVDGSKKITPEMIFVSEEYKGIREFSCEVYEVPEQVFKKITDTETPQGILGVFRKRNGYIEDIKGENILILNNLRDPGNIGTLLRTAKAAGFETVVADKGCADIYSPKTVRAAMSGIFGLNIVFCEKLEDFIPELKKKGYTIYAADMNGENMFHLKFSFPLGIILGNEANGVDDEVLKAAGDAVSIPMSGEMESLNAAVAGSVIMFEAARQKGGVI